MARLLILCLLGFLPACSTTPAGRPMGELASEINATRTTGEVVLIPGDVLAVSFPMSPDWNQIDLLVRADGRASFLSLDQVHVAGMTLSMLDELLTAEYSKILAKPDLTVRTTALAPSMIYVMGEVGEGGSFPLPESPISLPEALGMAGGAIRDTALLEHTMLLRWMPEENRTRAWKINASPAEWGFAEPILLQAHDVIYVPAQPVVHVNDWMDRYIRRMIPVPYLTFIQ